MAAWSFVQPFQSVCHPGRPSPFRFWCPPSRAKARRNSPTVQSGRSLPVVLPAQQQYPPQRHGRGRRGRPPSPRRVPPTQVHQQPGHHAQHADHRLHRLLRRELALPRRSPSSAPCGTSPWLGQRHSYQSTRSQASVAAPTATSVSSTHSSASAPRGGSGSQTRTAQSRSGTCRCSPRARGRRGRRGSVTAAQATASSVSRPGRAASPALADRGGTPCGLRPASGGNASGRTASPLARLRRPPGAPPGPCGWTWCGPRSRSRGRARSPGTRRCRRPDRRDRRPACRRGSRR